MVPDPSRALLIDARFWRSLSWAGVVAFAAALAVLLLLGRWPELRMAACFFVPLLVAMLVPHGLPNLLLAVIVACFLVSAAGWAWDWYARLWWFDVALHALNPLAILAGSMFMLWKAGFVTPIPRKGRFVATAAALGLLMGLGWELFELTFLDLTWPDTILDLVMDTAGAALGGWFAAWIIERRGVPPRGSPLAARIARAARRPPSARAIPLAVPGRGRSLSDPFPRPAAAEDLGWCRAGAARRGPDALTDRDPWGR